MNTMTQPASRLATPAMVAPWPDRDTRPPSARFPANACDCHAHVFGRRRDYPLAPGHSYVPAETLVDDYVDMLRRIGCERAVIVQPSVFATDNSCMVNALQSGRFPFRGVAVIDERTTDSELEDLHRAGVRGVRLNVKSKGTGATLEDAPRLAQRINARGWHLQIFIDLRVLPGIERELAQLPVDLVIDHFGHVAAADGMHAPGFQSLLRLSRYEHCWFKLSAPYRLSAQAPAFPDATPFARLLVDAAPDRCVWGTDWPHSGILPMPNDGDLANLLFDWIPDAALRNRVLVDNPARIYDFR